MISVKQLEIGAVGTKASSLSELSSYAVLSAHLRVCITETLPLIHAFRPMPGVSRTSRGLQLEAVIVWIWTTDVLGTLRAVRVVDVSACVLSLARG